jgi:hypothetical protein
LTVAVLEKLWKGGRDKGETWKKKEEIGKIQFKLKGCNKCKMGQMS